MDDNKKTHKNILKKRKMSNTVKKNIVIIISVLMIFFLKFISSKKNTDLKLILDCIDVTSNLSYGLIRTDDVVYMSMEDFSKFIDNTIYREDNTIIATSELKVASLEIDNNIMTINGSKQNISGAAFEIDEIVYIPISDMEKVYNINFKYSNSSNIVTIENLTKKKTIVSTKKKVSIKKEKNFFSKTISKVKKNEVLVYISQEGNWTKVMDDDGNIGYVKNNKLKDVKVEREEFEFKKNEQDSSNEDILEENITDENLDNFNNRMNLIEKIFTNAIENEKKYVKIIFNGNNSNFKRLEIEGNPIFNECGIYAEFINIKGYGK